MSHHWPVIVVPDRLGMQSHQRPSSAAFASPEANEPCEWWCRCRGPLVGSPVRFYPIGRSRTLIRRVTLPAPHPMVITPGEKTGAVCNVAALGCVGPYACSSCRCSPRGAALHDDARSVGFFEGGVLREAEDGIVFRRWSGR